MSALGWLDCTPRQLDCLRHAASDPDGRIMVDFASGTLSSLRQAGLLERVKVQGLTAYRITASGRLALEQGR